MKQIQAASRRLASNTGDRIVGLFALLESGQLTESRFRQLVAAIVASANVQGVALADLGLTTEYMRQVRRRSAPIGLRPTEAQLDQTRIARDVDRILANPPRSADTPQLVSESRRAQLHRLGRSEPLLTVAATVQLGMQRRGAKGWVRQLAHPSCDICERWADGVSRSPDSRMARHVGCDCIQQPQF